MRELDVKMLAKFKLAEARFRQQFLASDTTWDNLAQMYQVCVRTLPLREKLQSLARRHNRSPIEFCEKLMGRGWFQPPKQLPQRKAEAVLEVAPRFTRLLAAPHEMQDADARAFFKIMRTLAAKPAGRKRSEIYVKGLDLRNRGKSFHHICAQLVSDYGKMSSAERRAKREQMRSGVARLARSLSDKTG